MIRRKQFLAAALAALGLHVASAADYPDKPVRIVISFPAGAAADNAMRVIVPRMAEHLRQPVVIENRPSVHGIQSVATAPADGYTLLLAAGSGMVTGPLLRTKLTYNPTRDFAPVGRVLLNVPVLAVHPSLGVRTIKELVALAKKKPGGLDYSSSGSGSPGHLGMELFQQATGTSLVHIPYKGGGAPVTDLLAGHVPLGIHAVPSIVQQIRLGQVVPLAVASAKRTGALPDVPTMAEAGVPGFQYDIWYALFAPARTPPEVVARASAALQAALNDPEVAKRLKEQGAEPAPTTPQGLVQFMKEDTALWAKVIKERNLKID